MPGLMGLDALKQMNAENPKLPILVLSMHPEEQYAIRALKAGASGYLTKAAAPEQLIGAIERSIEAAGMSAPPSLKSSLLALRPALPGCRTRIFQTVSIKCYA